MSAQECKKPECPGCPMMVSRDGKESFCARCDGGDKVGMPRSGLVEPLAVPSHTRASSPTSSQDGSESFVLPKAEVSVPNTPPTPQSEIDSPRFQPSVPGVDPTIAAARRRQSDRASADIGRRLLQGWTLLGEECGNDGCYGIPLMRRPSPNRKNAQKDGEESNTPAFPKNLLDPRRYCVNCGRDSLREADIPAYEKFMAATQAPAQPLASTSTLPSIAKPTAGPVNSSKADEEVVQHTPAAKKRRFTTQPGTSSFGSSTVAASSAKAPPKPNVISNAPKDWQTKKGNDATLAVPKQAPTPVPSSPVSSEPTSAVKSLQLAVQTLSDVLNHLCEEGAPDGDLTRHGQSIADTAEALARTCRSLQQVKEVYQ